MEAPFRPPVSAGLFWCLVFVVRPPARRPQPPGRPAHIIEGHDASQYGIGIVSARIAEICSQYSGRLDFCGP